MTGLWRLSRGALRAAAALSSSSCAPRLSFRLRSCSSDSSLELDPGHVTCYRLSRRSLLRLRGADTRTFLQGIVTNDVTELEERPALYSHLLNVQGRTLYDVILYRQAGADGGGGVLLEFDSSVKESILKHLKVFRIRRDVTFSPCPDLCVWAVLSPHAAPGQRLRRPGLGSPHTALVFEEDPRTQLMGWRLVLQAQVDPVDLVPSSQRGDEEDYHRHRYRIGLPEGVVDLPPGVALPLESNLVYLQGISFSKGCYLGQELTARTHHTGVVRKRLMPVHLSAPLQGPDEGGALQTASGQAAGKHRAAVGEVGLSLVRLAHAKEPLTLRSTRGAQVTLQASEPEWWPKEEES